jgi:photosystem II stability/assembly factor-like uncharacterized protein
MIQAPWNVPARWFPVALALLALSAPLPAIQGEWHNLGPDGGAVLALAVSPADPQLVFAGTEAGVFRSVDGGASWAPANRGLYSGDPLTNPAVRSLVLDPSNPAAVYAGMVFDGIARSTDRGTTWMHIDGGLPKQLVAALALDPNNPARLFAATGTGLFLTSDGGATWRRLSRGLPPPFSMAQLVVVDPGSPRTVYAYLSGTTSKNGGLFKSTNGGTTWRSVSRMGLEGQSVVTLAISPRSPQTLYAGTAGPDGGVFVSHDGGASWRDTRLAAGEVHALAAHPTSPSILYAGTDQGVFRTTDGGAHWTAMSDGLGSSGVLTLAVSPASPRVLFAGTYGRQLPLGVFVSRNAAGSWRFSSKGLVALAADGFALDPQTPSTLWLGNRYGLFKSRDRGASWEALDISRCSTFGAGVIAVDPTAPDTVYVRTATREGQSVCRTRDGGATWEPTLQTPNPIYVLRLDPQNPATIYAAGRGLWRSTDRGETWSQLEPSSGLLILELLISPSSPATRYEVVFAPGGQELGILRSTDGGDSWIFMAPPRIPGRTFQYLALNPQDADTLYAAVSGALFKSVDGGNAWTPVHGAIRGQDAGLAFGGEAPHALYFWVLGDNVYESTDGGVTLSPLGSGPDYTLFGYFDPLTVDPQDPNRIYVATQNGALLSFTKTP